MIFINHRINTVDELRRVPKQNGIEIDIRYHNDELVLHHDPFGHHRNKPTLFTDLLMSWDNTGPMILNVKTEGVERACIDLMKRFRIEDWFFLDLSMPYFAVYAHYAAAHTIEGFGPANLSVRFSEREPIEYALAFGGKARWVWVDCFTRMPLTSEIADSLAEAGFRICMVSPELQKHGLEQIVEYRSLLGNIRIDAVCTKRPDLWGQDL